MDAIVLMLAVRFHDDRSAHNKATMQRWVLVVQEHAGSRGTRIPILGFPQRKQQKRYCCTSWHEYCKPTDANKTPQMACLLYLRPGLLCPLALWDRFTSSCFVVPQSLALESSLTPQILHRFGAPASPPPSRWRRRHPSYPVALATAVFATGCNRLLALLQMVGGRFGPCNKWILQSEGTTSGTVGKDNGNIATTTGSNGFERH